MDKVRMAAERFRQAAPGIASDGELQGDAALVPEVAARKEAIANVSRLVYETVTDGEGPS